MANIALNLLPKEKDSWVRPEEATNGNITRYDGGKGFASAVWPCTYTLDLGEERKLSTIRFLLWDNLGRINSVSTVSRVPDKRKYRFTLSLSSDGENFFTIYTNQDQQGGNGWYSFRLLDGTYARFVRLAGHFNSVNQEFHIVEFEIHDREAPEIASKNVHYYDLATYIPSEQKINEIVERQISTKTVLLTGIDDKIKSLDDALKRSNQSLTTIELIKKSTDFSNESKSNSNRAKGWLAAASGLLILFLCALIYFVFCDDHSVQIIKNSAKNSDVKNYTGLLLGSFYAGKAVFLSTLLFLLTWFLKNYRSEKHNYIVNKHKAMSLTVATAVLTQEEYKNTDRGNIFNEAMNIILSHQVSGFSKDDNNSPSVVNALLQRTPKIES